MSVVELFKGIQVTTAFLALISFSVGFAIGETYEPVPLDVLGLLLFTMATAAGLAVLALEPEAIIGGRSAHR